MLEKETSQYNQLQPPAVCRRMCTVSLLQHVGRRRMQTLLAHEACELHGAKLHARLVAEGGAILAVLQHICCCLLPRPRALLKLLQRSCIRAAALQERRRPPAQHIPTAVACCMRAAAKCPL